MQEVFNKYIAYLQAERNASTYTVRNYTNDLMEFFDFVRGKDIKSLKEINKQTLRGYLSHLMEQGFAKSSIARKLSAIRSFYRYLMREEMVSVKPGRHHRFPQAGQAPALVSHRRRGQTPRGVP